MKKILIIILLSCGLTSLAQEDVSLLRSQHQTQWTEAEEYAQKCHDAWATICGLFEIDQQIAEAVVFPEMIRYSIFRDRMETAAVKGTYISRGTRAFDFSIGHFQMKPSFVETIERRWMRSPYPKLYDAYFDTADSQFARRARIERICDNTWQYAYLAMFIKLLYLDYGSLDKNKEKVQDGLETLPVEEQIRLIATAYNRGCRWTNPGYGSLDELRAKSREKHFHLAFIPNDSTTRYAYADIALSHWMDGGIKLSGVKRIDDVFVFGFDLSQNRNAGGGIWDTRTRQPVTPQHFSKIQMDTLNGNPTVKMYREVVKGNHPLNTWTRWIYDGESWVEL